MTVSNAPHATLRLCFAIADQRERAGPFKADGNQGSQSYVELRAQNTLLPPPPSGLLSAPYF